MTCSETGELLSRMGCANEASDPQCGSCGRQWPMLADAGLGWTHLRTQTCRFCGQPAKPWQRASSAMWTRRSVDAPRTPPPCPPPPCPPPPCPPSPCPPLLPRRYNFAPTPCPPLLCNFNFDHAPHRNLSGRTWVKAADARRSTAWPPTDARGIGGNFGAVGRDRVRGQAGWAAARDLQGARD